MTRARWLIHGLNIQEELEQAEKARANETLNKLVEDAGTHDTGIGGIRMSKLPSLGAKFDAIASNNIIK